MRLRHCLALLLPMAAISAFATLSGSSQASSAAPAPAPHAPVVTAGPALPGGAISASVPVAAIGSSDQLPATLTTRTTYVADVAVWLAAGQPAASVSMEVTGAQCMRAPDQLVAAKVVHLRCSFSVSEPTPDLAVVVDVRPRGEPAVRRVFHHRVSLS